MPGKPFHGLILSPFSAKYQNFVFAGYIDFNQTKLTVKISENF